MKTDIDVVFDCQQDTFDVEIGLTDRLPEQDKEQTITTNGTHVVTADEGKALKKVTTNVDVIPDVENKTLNITANGTYSAEPNDKHNSLKVTANVNVRPNLEALQIDVTSPDMIEYTPDKADGYGYVSVRPVTQEKTITANGTYSVDAGYCGFGTVVVDEPFEQLTATENGTYTPTEPNVGFDSVEVDVQPKLQKKRVTLTKSDPLVVTPDSGYDGIDNMSIEQNLQMKTVTANGSYRADSGYNGIKEVIVAIPLEDSKSATYTENGIYSIEPTSGQTAMKKASVTVNVPPTPTQEKSVTYTKNGSYSVVPDTGKDLSKISVEVVVPPTEIDCTNKSGSMADWFRYYDIKGAIKVTNVTNEVTSMLNMFFSNRNLTELQGLDTWNTSGLRDMRYVFADCTSLTSLDLSKWNTASVINCEGMFWGCTSLVSLDVSTWNMSKVTNIDSIFRNCHKLTSLDLSNWNVSNVTNMINVFNSCSSLTSVGDLSKWDTSNVTDISHMFQQCVLLPSLDLSNWNTGSVVSAIYIFSSCISLTTVIGSHTLAEVESGTIVALKDMGKSVASVDYQGTSVLLYASALALFNGLYNKTGGTTGTLQFSNTAFNTYTTEQQTTLRTIASNKNYTLTLV